MIKRYLLYFLIMTKEEFKKWCSEKLKYKGVRLLEYVDKNYEKYYGHYKKLKIRMAKLV